ncbi:MAG TPA: type II toxin-antitoxin system death-on-curing family toxin [Thermoanaerobaculia bacterium]|nr:type II toxin-antitoxin system death-on-curing family toxin [Thermoanaerobaculia bacterium]
MDPLFLTLEEVLVIHESRIRRYGGRSGIRDIGLLQSAVGTVGATFAGTFLHTTLFEMAAAYLFHICRNHPFVDGNKRTALACALAFLHLNGVTVEAEPDDLYELVMRVASGAAGKSDVAVFLRSHAAG